MIHFKFKSAKDFDQVECDGPYITAHDVKLAIVSKAGLAKDPNFDLQLINSQSNEEYGSESALIPANTSLIVRRVPVKSRPGAGGGKRFEQPTAPVARGGPAPPVGGGASGAMPLLAGGGEAERIEALLSQGPGWAPGQVVPNRPKFMQDSGPQKPPPPLYQCHRCQQYGHWINQCPTNGDPKFDFKRVKKATGIPKAFLQVVSSGEAVDGSLMLPDGGYAKVRTNEGAFAELALGDQDLDLTDAPPGFKCTLCSQLLVNATKLPCCAAVFCDKCIRKKLLQTKFSCPACGKPEMSPDNLGPCTDLRRDIEKWRLGKLEAARGALRGRLQAKDGAGATSNGGPAFAAAASAAASLSSAAAASSTLFTPGIPAGVTVERTVTVDPERGTITRVIGLDYKYEEVQRGRYVDKFIDDERVCRDWDLKRSCSYGHECAFLHPEPNGRDLRGGKEERAAIVRARTSGAHNRRSRSASPRRRKRSRSRSRSRSPRRDSPPRRSPRRDSPPRRRDGSPRRHDRSRSNSRDRDRRRR